MNTYEVNGGQAIREGAGWGLTLPPMDGRRYADAQIDDYQGLPRRRFRWRPPLTLTVRARFSHPADELVGTAGFGFWNDPFMMTGARFPALPRAVWFFYASPPSDMALACDVPGYGWKAAVIDAGRLPFWLLAPTAPLAIPMMNARPLYRALWPIGQRALGIAEALAPADMTMWHTYRLEWDVRRVRFGVDDVCFLDGAPSPRGPLGFVMWLDNQAMIATPWGRFAHRVLPTSAPQWVQVESVSIQAAS